MSLVRHPPISIVTHSRLLIVLFPTDVHVPYFIQVSHSARPYPRPLLTRHKSAFPLSPSTSSPNKRPPPTRPLRPTPTRSCRSPRACSRISTTSSRPSPSRSRRWHPIHPRVSCLCRRSKCGFRILRGAWNRTPISSSRDGYEGISDSVHILYFYNCLTTLNDCDLVMICSELSVLLVVLCM